MLNEFSTRAATTLAVKLTDANIILEPVVQSVLANAVEANNCLRLNYKNPVVIDGRDDVLQDSGNPSAVAMEMMEVSMQKNGDGVSEHDETLAGIVANVVEVVQTNLMIARTIVNPIVKEVFEETNRQVTELDTSAVQVLSVAVQYFGELWDSPVFGDMIERYTQSPVRDISLRRVFPALDYEALRGLLRTGSASFDKQVEAYVNTLGETSLKDIYFSLFQRHAHNEGLSHSGQLSDYIGADRNRDHILMAHLISRRLLADVPEGVEMSLLEYKDYVSGIVEQTGRVLCRVQDARRRIADSKILVESYPDVSPEYMTAENAVIKVNGDLYNQFLKDGGSPEILFGCYITGNVYDRLYGYDELLASAEKNTRVWERHFGLMVERRQDERSSTIVTAIRAAVLKQISVLESEYVASVSKDALKARLTEVLGRLGRPTQDDLFNLVRMVVCQTIFPHTEAERILKAIDAQAIRNPKLKDVRELALLATIDVTAEWLLSLMVVKSVTE